MQKELKAAASFFRLGLPITYSLANSSETISSTQEGHLVYAGNIDKGNMFETIARAKLYEEIKEDLVNLDFVQVEARSFEQATTIFSNLTMPLLSCWTFDLMREYLSDEQLANEVDYLEVLYEKICVIEHPAQHQPILGAVCISTLLHLGHTDKVLCDNLKQMSSVVDVTTAYAKNRPSLQVMIGCFNALNGPFKAAQEEGRIRLIPSVPK